MTRVLLVSTYEQGHQPLGLAAPAAYLRARGHEVRCLDRAVETPQPEAFDNIDLVGISLPMHTAARLGLALAERIRRLQPHAVIVLYGLYASLLQEHVDQTGLADAVVGGEYEVGLGTIADNLASIDSLPSADSLTSVARTPGAGALPLFPRQQYLVPDRHDLPSLDAYARFDPGDGDLRLVGYVESTRGCAHRCAHCPLTPTYGGRLRLIQPDTVLADIDQLVDLGAQHITFGDPDSLNAASHADAITDALHRRHPALTFDATIKVEHLLEHAGLLPRLRDRGLAFITSAFESVDDQLLTILDKGHTHADMEHALAITAGLDLPLRPTWLPFTPWTSRRDLLNILEFVDRHDLIDHVQPVQYALRLLLPPGSPLVPLIEADGHLTGFDVDGLTHTWRHPDPEMDQLQARLARSTAAEADLCDDTDEFRTTAVQFHAIHQAVRAAQHDADQRPPLTVSSRPPHTVPGLTENWFC